MSPCLKTKKKQPKQDAVPCSQSLLQQVLVSGVRNSLFSQVLKKTAAFLETYTNNLETIKDGLGDDSSVDRTLAWHGQDPGFSSNVGVGSYSSKHTN